MSTTVDNRVVQMEFDNRKFESNVETSMSTLDKLKKALNLDNAAKGLSGISAAAKKVDMNPIGRAAETVGLKFNALYTVADQALRNITNSAMMHGKRIVSALTIDPVKTGFSEYETKLGSIQTIMSNTASKGTTMADVTQVIDELNTYADKTIYNFAEMTKNIGTFTAAGVGLEESAAAIQGIANLAAASGSTSQQASTAMYQLSQALAAGSVKLMDWNSVVNAGMGGEKFQEALKATARDHGVAVDKIIEKNGSFRESLSEGWITADILNETLNKFTVEGAKNYAQSMMESGQWTQKQADALIKEAQAMEDAATKVKTFTQLWDTLKESAQSGWGKTWELIVGDFESAKEMWTGVSNVLGGIIEKSANARNDAIEGALTSNWGKLTKEVNAAGIETKEFEEIVKNVARNEGYNVDKLIEEYGSLENVFHKGAIQSWVLKRALNGVGDSTADLSKVARDLTFNMKGEDVKQVEEALLSLGYTLTGKDGKFYGDDGYYGTLTRDAVKAFQEVEGLKVTGIVDDETLKALKEATKGASIFDGELDELADSVTELSGRQKLLTGFKYFFKGFKNILEPVGKAFREVFPRTTSDQISGLIDKFYDLSASFVTFTGSVKGQKVIAGITAIFKTLFSVIDLGLTVIKEISSTVFGILFKGFLKGIQGTSMFSGSLAESITAVKDWIVATGFIPAVIGKVSQWFQNGVEFVKKFATSVTESVSSFVGSFGGVGEMLTALFGAPFALAISKLGEFIDRVKNYKKFNKNTLSFMFLDFKTNVLEYFKKVDPKSFFGGFTEAIKSFIAHVKGGFGSIGGKFEAIITKIKDFGSALKENLGDNIGAIIAIGTIATLILIIKKIKDAVELLVKPLGFLEDLGQSMTGLGKSLKFAVKAEALKNIAIALAILAGSLILLSFIPYGKLWSAVGAMAVMGGVLIGLILVLNKVTDNIGQIVKLGGTLMMLAGSMVLLAVAAKIIAGIDAAGIGQCILIMGGFIGAIALISKTFSKGKLSKGTQEFGIAMLSLAGTMVLLGVAMKILGGIDGGSLLKGGLAIITFLGMMVGMMAATKLIGPNMGKFAGTMAGLAGAMLIFSVVVRVFGKMKPKVLIQGGLAVAAFLGMMVGMMAATKLLAKDMPKFGRTMLGMSAGLLALAVTAKILGGMDPSDLVKGMTVISSFLLMMTLMMAATRLLGKNAVHSAKFGVMMLAFSGAVLILSGAIAIIGSLKRDAIHNAIEAIQQIAILFGALMVVTRFATVADNAKGTILSLSIAIGILAISLAALSFAANSNSDGLRKATMSLVGVMAAFAVLVAATKFMKVGFKSIATLVVMVGALVILAETIKRLQSVDADSALKTAVALSLLITTLAGACALIGVVGMMKSGIWYGLAAFAALSAIVGVIVGIAVNNLPAIGTKLSEFAAKAQPFFNVISTVTPDVGTGVKNLATGILALTASSFLNKITSWKSQSTLSAFGDQISLFADDLATFLTKINNALNTNSEDKQFDFTRIEKAIDIAVRLGEIASLVPANAGELTGPITDIGVFGDQITKFADGLNTYLAKITDPFNKLDKNNSVPAGSRINFTDVEKATNIGVKLAEIAEKIPATGGSSTDYSTKDLGAFGTQLGPFADGLSVYLSKMGSPLQKLVQTDAGPKLEDTKVDWEQIGKATDMGERLANIAKDAPATDGFMGWFEGKDLASFGEHAAGFASGLSQYLTTMGTPLQHIVHGEGVQELEDPNWEQIEKATGMGERLAAMASDISPTSGMVTWFANKDLGSFGEQAAAFAWGLSEYITNMGQPLAAIAPTAEGGVTYVEPNWTQIEKATDIGERLATLASTIEPTSGMKTWFVDKDLGDFGTQVAGFADGLKTFLTEIGTPFEELVVLPAFHGTAAKVVTKDVDFEKVGEAVTIGTKLAEMATLVPETSKWQEWFSGEKDIGEFGKELGPFAEGLKTFLTTVGDVATTTNDTGDSAETIDTSKIDAAIATATQLAGLAGTIAADTKGWDWLTGSDDLGDFGGKLSKLGEGLAGFSSYVSGEDFDVSSVTLAVAQIKSLANLGTTVGSESFGNLGQFATNIGELGRQLWSFGNSIKDVDTTKIANVGTALAGLASVDIDNADTLQSFINSLGSVGTEGVTAFADAISSESENVLTKATTLGEKLLEGLKTGTGSIGGYFTEALSSSNTTIRSYRTKFRLSGQYVVQGLTQGIRNGKSGAINEIIILARKLLETFNHELGIYSPSKETYKSGAFMCQGLINGLASYDSKVSRAGASMADHAMRGLNDAVGTVYDLISNGIDAEPTIRPVLDLSAVSAGANQINGMLAMNPSIGAMANVTAINSMMGGRQNGSNGDVVSAIKELGASLSGNAGVTNNYINGVSNGDGNVADAIGIIVSAAMRERRA